ncbi:MAG: protein kinase domain-containing protein [Planctomycetota bacterium]|jgi:non-specific serine/threonine protein kinase/serine/threonine-protein kinase
MDESYKRAKELFLSVCDLGPDERDAAIGSACGDDAELRGEVESLLDHYDETRETSVIPSGEMSRASVDRDEATPDRIGSYRVLRELSRGGMGVIYLGEDERFHRRVAIKVVKRGMDTEAVLHRFELERRLLAALNHQGISRLYDGGETPDGLPYFVMEYVEGRPLDQFCDTHCLTIAERLQLFASVCDAVHYAHQNLVVHRDLKPGNILVTEEGVPKLLDFGIAKLLNPELSLMGRELTSPGTRVMTPEYASPEQVRGEPITTGSDVYSLGVLLYQLVSGHRPYRLRRRVRAEIERAICEDEPERPSTAVSRVDEAEEDELTTADSTHSITPESVSRVRGGRPERIRKRLAGDIDNIVLMAMRKAPQRRYASAGQLAEDIRRHLGGMPVVARPDTISYRFSKFVRRHRAGVAAAAFIALSLIGGISGTSWQAQVTATQRDRANVEREIAERRLELVQALARTFMFDFHDSIQKLEGSIPAREMLVTTALKTLDDLSQEVGENPILKRDLASAYERVGDIRGGIRNPSLGDTDGALESYRAALELREAALFAAAPDDAKARDEVAKSHTKVGDMLTNSGDVAGALAAYREALATRQRLLVADPGSVETRRDLAIALGNVGATLIETADIAGAKENYDRSLALRKEVAAAEPGNRKYQRDLSVGHIRVGGLLERTGDYENAVDQYREAVKLRGRILRAEPESGRATRDLAIAHYMVAHAYLGIPRADLAGDHLDHFLSVSAKRVADSPNDARAIRDLALAHEIVGRAYALTGDSARALEQYRAFQSVIMPLSASDPTNTQFRGLIGRSYERLGDLAAADGEVDVAIDDYRQALEVFVALADADPEDVPRATDRARLLARLGAALAETRDRGEAQRRLEAALDLYESLFAAQPQIAAVRDGLATTLVELSSLMADLADGERAERYAQEAQSIAGRPTPAMLRARAEALHLTGDDAGAAEAATEALRMLGEGEGPAEVERLRRTLEEDLARYRDQ